MAYVKDVFSAAGSSAQEINYLADEGDFMLLIHSRRYGSTPSDPSGWTALSYTSVTSGGVLSKIWYRKATASEPTSVTVTAGVANHGLQLIVCGGVDATTPFDVTVTSRSSGSASFVSAPAITPATDRALILYLNVTNNSVMMPVPGPIKIERSNSSTNGGAINSYYTYGGLASVAVPALDFYSEADSNINPTLVTVALRDDGSDVKKGYISVSSPPVDILHLLGKNGETGHLTDTPEVNVSSTITALQGTTTTNNTNPSGSQQVSLEEGFLSAGYSTTAATSDCAVTASSVTTAYDLENAIISFTSSGDPGMYSTYGVMAKTFGLGDGTNFRMWKVDASNTFPSGKSAPMACVIEVDGGFESEEYGTVNSSVLGALDHFVMAGPALARYRVNAFAFCYKHNTMNILGGSTTLPASMATAVECAGTGSLRTVSAQGGQSETQFFCAHKIKVGDGSVPTVWNSSRDSIEFPSAYNEAGRRVQVQVSEGSFGFTMHAGASCNLNFSSTTFNMGDFNPWGYESGTSTSATYNEQGAVIISANPQLEDIGRAMSGMSFIACKEVTKNSADLSGGNTFDNCDDDQCFTVTTEADFEDLHNCQFRNNSVSAIKITGDQSGSWSDPNFTMSNNTVDIVYTGATNFQIQSAKAISVSNTGAGTLTIVTPVQTFSLNSDTSSTLIRYFEDDSQAIVDSTTGVTLDYNFPDTDPIDIEFVKQGYVPVNRQNIIPYDGDFDVIMDFDEAYNSAHGLTNGSEYDVVRATKTLTINSDQNALDVRSAFADDIRTDSSYYNTKLFMVPIPGLTRVDLIDGATITSMATWKGAGMERFDAADSSNPVEKWLAIKSVGSITGATTHYRQTSSGDSTAVTLTNNVVDEAFQYWSDPNHDGSTTDGYDYSGYMLVKSFLAGSKQGRVDVLANAGLSVLASNFYTVPLSNESHGYSGSDPGISADITLVAGSTVGGVVFSYEIVDGGTNTGANIADQLNYNAANNPNAVIPGGTGLRYFELPDMVIHNASSVETARGYREGSTPALVGFYVSRSGVDHPDFTRFQGDNGSYYAPAVLNQSTITNLPADGAHIRLQIRNKTTATEIYSDDPGATAYSDTYTEGTDYTEGDEIRIRFAELNGSTSFKYFETTVTAGAAGWSLNAANFIISDPVYAENAVDGSTVTKFTYSSVNDQFNLAIAANFVAAELFAFYCMTLTTAPGIEGAFGAFVAENSGNYKNIVSIANIFLDNETTASQRQTDSARIYKDDESYPVLDPTTSGYGIDVNWKNVVYVVTAGSGLDAGQQAQLTSAAEAATVNTKIGTPAVTIADDISNISGGSAPTVEEIRAEIDANSTQLAAIISDTGTDIPNSIAALPAQNADKLLGRNLAGGSDGGRVVRDALRPSRNRVVVDPVAKTVTCYEEDDTTVAWSGDIELSERNAIDSVDPA